MSRVPHGSEVGIVKHAMVYMIADNAHTMIVLKRFNSKPWKENWATMKRFFKYLCATSDYVLCYQGRVGLDRVLDIHGFVDVDQARDIN